MNAALSDRILSHIQQQQPALIDLLQHMVDTDSPSAQPDSHRLIRSVLSDELQQVGFRVTTLSCKNSHHHIYARPKERQKDKPIQLLIGHYDTVWPLGTANHRPFTVDENIARGPGVFDMKGGLVQIIFALKTINELGLELPLVPIVFMNSDEEIGSRTSTRYVRALSQRSKRAFVMEPAMGEEGALKTERKGIGNVTFEGRVTDARKCELLQRSHVLCTTPVKEGWGMVVNEANAMGTPALGYNVPGLRDALAFGNGGLCSPSPQAMATELAALYEQWQAAPSAYEQLRETCLSTARQWSFDRSYREFRAALCSNDQ